MLGGNVAFYPFQGAPSLLMTLQRCGERIVILSVGPRRSSRNTVFGIQAKSHLATTETHMDSLWTPGRGISFMPRTLVTMIQWEVHLKVCFLYSISSAQMIRTKWLFQGKHTKKYYDDYHQRLSQVAAQYNISLNPNPYANALHDSVWATAIALNASLQTIKTGTAEKIRNWNKHCLANS